MKEQKRLIQVFMPSLMSGLFTVGISIAGLIAAALYYLSGNGAVYNFLFGPNSSAELIQHSKGVVDAFSNTVFGNPTLNKILYFAFWMLVGLIVYFLLYVAIKGTTSAATDIEEATYKNARVHEMLEAIATRFAIRILLIILWIIYWVLFVKILLPFSILSSRVGVSHFPAPNGWFYIFSGVFVLIVSVHIHVIFMRLITLRVRLFDSSDVAS